MPASIIYHLITLKIMETKGHKGLLGVTIFASFLCIASIVWILVQSYYVCTESGEGCIVWHEKIYVMQMSIFIGRLLFKNAFYALIVVFLIKQYKAVKNGVLFPRVNIGIMYTIAACYLIGNFCHMNFETLVIPATEGIANLVISTDILIYTMLLLVFASVYKIAVKVSEENNLTI